jgi:hypothetical protein
MIGSDGTKSPVSHPRIAAMRIAVIRISLGVVVVAAGTFSPMGERGTVFAACPERPACRGCGCKGGPGYRGPDGRCVGFQALDKVCGRPPETRCSFENAPGTGANRDCATGEGEAKKSR